MFDRKKYLQQAVLGLILWLLSGWALAQITIAAGRMLRVRRRLQSGKRVAKVCWHP